jgi:hypothetical protein
VSELALQAARKIDPRKAAIALLAIWSMFGVAGLVVDRGYAAWSLQTFNPQHSDLALQVSTTAGFTAFLMLCAAGMAFALAGVDQTRRERKWRLAAWALLALGVEEMLGVHPWLQSKDLSWTLSYLPILVPAALALLPAFRMLQRQAGGQAVFGAAIVLWLTGAVVDNPALGGSEGGAELIWIGAAIMFTLTTLARLHYLASQYYPLNEADSRISFDQIAAEALARVPFRRLAIGIGLVWAATVIQYVLFHDPGYPHCPAVLDPCHARDASHLGILDVNNEQTLPPTFQAALLLITGGLALVVGRLRATGIEMKRWWLTLGLVILVLAFDQVLAVHSRFGDATGLPGQLILLPAAIAGIVAWFKVLQEIWDNRLARSLFVAGALVWALSQASDVLLDPVKSLGWTTVPEETAETVGSSLWLFSVLVWLRSMLPAGLVPPGWRLNGLPLIEQLSAPGQRSKVPTG